MTDDRLPHVARLRVAWHIREGCLIATLLRECLPDQAGSCAYTTTASCALLSGQRRMKEATVVEEGVGTPTPSTLRTYF